MVYCDADDLFFHLDGGGGFFFSIGGFVRLRAFLQKEKAKKKEKEKSLFIMKMPMPV